MERLSASPLAVLYKGPLFDKVSALTAKMNASKGLPARDFLGSIDHFQGEYLADIDRYKAIYGEEFFTEDAIARGAMNAIAMKLFAQMHGQDAPNRDAVNAIALLHPITDEVIDKGQLDPKTMLKLTRLLEGRPQTAESPYERLVFGFVESIYQAFPRDKHPELDYTLQRLHAIQLASNGQRFGMDEEKMLRTTFTKGGLSTAAAGYIALGGLTAKQSGFFFKGGGIFQIMDDLSDIAIDMSEKVETTWTSPLRQGKSLLLPMRRFLHLEKTFESELDDLVSDFSDPAAYAWLYRFGYKVRLMQGLEQPSVPQMRPAARLVQARLPVRLGKFKQLATLLKSQKEPVSAPSSQPWQSMASLWKMYERY